ncbi:MAG: hypothetical protein GXP09_07225 [Gammaproteobacteria bacterium]|nr:hypothetical protein [Gammaproteobacteria bacterium]
MMTGFGSHPEGFNNTLQNEIRVLENRVTAIEDMGNSAYERLLIRAYSDMIEQRKKVLLDHSDKIACRTAIL